MNRQISQITAVILCLAPAVIIGASFAHAPVAHAVNSPIATLLVMERSILGR